MTAEIESDCAVTEIEPAFASVDSVASFVSVVSFVSFDSCSSRSFALNWSLSGSSNPFLCVISLVKIS